MKQRVSAFLFAAVASAACTHVYAQQSGWTGGQGAGFPTTSPCATFASTVSGTYNAVAGETNGEVGTPQPGETYTISIVGPGTGSWRIVGDAAGVVTFAGPATVPGTLTYTVTGAPPMGAQGVGFFFDSGDQGLVTVTASCSRAGVPATSPWSLAMLMLLAGLTGAGALYVRQRAA